jgi:Protein of unknown function (DUF1091)
MALVKMARTFHTTLMQPTKLISKCKTVKARIGEEFLNFRELLVIISVMTPSQKDFNDYDRSVTKTTVNLCSLTETMNSNMWLKNAFQSVMSCASFDSKCPLAKV